MNIVKVFELFPTEKDCIKYLEKIRWKSKPTCPYCQSENITQLPKESRHHCNNCNTSFSVTVRTIFHDSKLPLQKWFLAISLILNAKKGISARQLARDIKVNKNTAWYMNMRIRRAMLDQRELLTGVVEMDDTYIGGKPRKQFDPDGGKNKTGRGTKKQAVVGMAERKGKVRAMPVKNTKGKILRALVRRNVNVQDAILITDDYSGYARMEQIVEHETVNHQIWYINGPRHTNTIESFWALLKRGVVSQYHKVSLQYLPRYIDEFCYRYNNRFDDSIFETTISNAVRGI